jgi:type I restriction enzyme M protein
MTNIKDLENRLWEAADHMRANSPLRLNEFAEPVLGLIFLKFAGVKHGKTEKEVAEERKKKTKSHGGASVSRERPVSSADYHARGVLFVPEKARFSYLIELPEGTDMGRAVNDAMKEIETENKELAGILPKTFQKLDNRSIIALLKNFNQIPDDIEGDAFGRIYEYFLGKFALADGSRGGEFFTPTSIVKLIVEILEPYQGRIYDPACGSGGMFVQSHEFVKRHLENGHRTHAAREISIYGQEKTDQTVRIAKMNLAIHGLSGDIREGNTYYEDRHKSVGKFDFTMANPPFNVSDVDMERIKDDRRFSYGLPKADNANYLWIQIFLASLNENGRAGFVMHNSAVDSELEIRKQLINDGVADVILTTTSNLFYNVNLPCTLWFFDKSKKRRERKEILFIDAWDIYRQVTSVQREITDEQISKIAGIVKSFRKEKGASNYKDIRGLCKKVSINEIKRNNYSLNPKAYIQYDRVTKNGNNGEKSSAQNLNQSLDLFNDLSSRISKELGKNVPLDRGLLLSLMKALYKNQILSLGSKVNQVPLREVVEYYIGGTWGQEKSSDKFNNFVRVFRGTDMESALIGEVVGAPTRYISSSQLGSRLLLSGDIIIEVSGGGKDQSTGRTMYISQNLINRVPPSSVCASFCKLMRIKKDIVSPVFVFLFLQDLYDSRLISRFEVQSTGIKNFKFENFLDKQLIGIPDSKSQKKFDNLCEEIFELMHAIGALKEVTDFSSADSKIIETLKTLLKIEV